MKTLKQQPFRDAGVCIQPLRVSDVINALRLMAGSWLRHNCGVSLRMLVKRPGRIALTATHWDVIFDIDQTDLRLRRVALDTDPGWVPWLGRVVTYFYRDGPCSSGLEAI